MPQRRRQNGSHTQPPTACQIHLGIVFGVIAKHNFAAAQALGGNARVCLQPNSHVRRGSPSARAADHFASAAKRDGSPGCPCQRLRALCNYTDHRLKINLRIANAREHWTRVRKTEHDANRPHPPDLTYGGAYSISGTVESSSRTRRFSSSSSIRRAKGCDRSEPPNKRDRLRTALLPHARQAVVVFCAD